MKTMQKKKQRNFVLLFCFFCVIYIKKIKINLSNYSFRREGGSLISWYKHEKEKQLVAVTEKANKSIYLRVNLLKLFSKKID
jgi:hypothetical protein